jgi:flavin-dependent dehydrogenase
VRDVDVLVAGGGPVGLAAALRAREAGLSVAVVEPRSDPVDKACGEGLMPRAVAALADLGVTPPGRPFAGIRYVAPGRAVAARFRAGPGLGARRTDLHAALAAAADAAGVKRVLGTVTGVGQDATGVSAAGLRAGWLLAADGLHSPVRRGLGLDRPPPGARRYGLRRHYSVAPWSDFVEVYWADRAEAYVTPVSEHVVGVALLVTEAVGGSRATYDELLAGFPALLGRLRAAEPLTPVRGAGPLRQAAATPRLGRVLLVGDAAGYVDALTGEGLTVGLATARAAVAAVARDRPEAYPAAWRACTRRYRWSAGALLAAAARPQLRRRVVPAAAALPAVFGLAVDHVA